MSDSHYATGGTRAGTIGGTLLVLLLHIDHSEILKTVILAGTGAAVSFTVSRGLQWAISAVRRRMKSTRYYRKTGP